MLFLLQCGGRGGLRAAPGRRPVSNALIEIADLVRDLPDGWLGGCRGGETVRLAPGIRRVRRGGAGSTGRRWSVAAWPVRRSRAPSGDWNCSTTGGPAAGSARVPSTGGRRPGRCGAGWPGHPLPDSGAARRAGPPGSGWRCGFAGARVWPRATVGSSGGLRDRRWGWAASTGVTVAVPRAGRTVPVTTASVGWTGSGSAGTVPNASPGAGGLHAPGRLAEQRRIRTRATPWGRPQARSNRHRPRAGPGLRRPRRPGAGSHRPAGGPGPRRARPASGRSGSGPLGAGRTRVCRSSRAAPREGSAPWLAGPGRSRDGSAARATGRTVASGGGAGQGGAGEHQTAAVTPPPAVAGSATVQPCRRASRPTTNSPSTSVGARSSRSRRVNRAFSSASRSRASCRCPWSTRSAGHRRRSVSAVTVDPGVRRRERGGVLHQLGQGQHQVTDDAGADHDSVGDPTSTRV